MTDNQSISQQPQDAPQATGDTPSTTAGNQPGQKTRKGLRWPMPLVIAIVGMVLSLAGVTATLLYASSHSARYDWPGEGRQIEQGPNGRQVGFPNEEGRRERPSGMPTNMPSGFPTDMPSGFPTDMPREIPSGEPNGRPTDLPSINPNDDDRQWSEQGQPQGNPQFPDRQYRPGRDGDISLSGGGIAIVSGCALIFVGSAIYLIFAIRQRRKSLVVNLDQPTSLTTRDSSVPQQPVDGDSASSK